MRKALIGTIAIMAALGFVSAAQATTLFEIDANPSGAKLLLTKAKDSASSTGTVVTTDDVGIAVVGNSDFADGFSTITPVKGGTLTELTFTPVNGDAFASFSFRGQDEVANQTIDVIIQDNQGHAPETFMFTVSKPNEDFGRLGIIAAVPGETIKSVEIMNSGGFEEAKQFEFDLTPVPEPGAWLMMIAGLGLLGAALRVKGTNLVEA